MSTLAFVFLSLFLLFSTLSLAALPLEKLDLWLKVISSVLAGLTVAVGIGAFVTSERLNDMLKDRVATLGRETAVLQKETAVAKQKQAESEERMALMFKLQGPRRLPYDTFIEALKDKPKGQARIMFQPDDWEAFTLAGELWVVLSAGGWAVSPAIPIPSDAATESLQQRPEILSKLPPTVRIGAEPSGVTIFANKIEGENTAYRSLVRAFLASGFRMHLGLDVRVDKRLPDNSFLIVVGPKEQLSIELRK